MSMKKLFDIDKHDLMFHNKALFALLIPIVVEQLLNSFMGMVDTMMVSNLGSQAISGVSLVDSVNNLIVQLFSAMATGAAIICSHYIGMRNKDGANKAARQVVLTVMVISLAITILGLIFRRPLLTLIFGHVEQEVMDNAVDYFLFTALSYPFLALFSAGSAIFRSCGNSRYPMTVSVISNVFNIGGNALLMFVFKLGVSGAAISTLVSRVFCMVVIFIALSKPKLDIVVKDYAAIRPDFGLIKSILAIGVPSGIENSMFQFGKLAIQSTVSTLGTAAIAAQAMTNILENVNGIFGIGVGMCLMTVVGQTLGAGRKEEAKYYIVKLAGIAELGIIASCLLVYAFVGPITRLGGMETDSARMCIEMVGAITIVKPLVWVLSFVPAYGMRAAGDVRFSMITSIITMWGCRVALSIVLIRIFDMGPMGVWYGMFADWTIRGIIFTTRFFSERWVKKVI
ncbi:MAG: MATE family efflux transporter [Lachnospira sp.]|uniref:MATE family efflux transporter n=1 Tax=Lachnospira sp. TaxID=2049031 RepID=UPI003A38D15C